MENVPIELMEADGGCLEVASVGGGVVIPGEKKLFLFLFFCRLDFTLEIKII